MANPYPKLTLPSANVPLGTATVTIRGEQHTAEIKISQAWLQQLLKLVKQLNQNTSDLNP